MKEIKIVCIGGGSSYTPELIEGFINEYHNLPIKELWLVDIKEGEVKLNTITNLAKRMIKKANIPIEIYSTLDRRSALRDADFVITQLRVGLLDARIKDEKIPLKYGVIGQETNGAGGLFKALRTIPVILDIDKDMSELCPNAWLINFTNPAGIITEALLKYGKNKKVIGLCNVPTHMKMDIAKALNFDYDRVHVDFAGLNHMVYGLNVYLDGENVTNKLIDIISSNEGIITIKNITGFEWEKEFLKELGVIPCPYHNYYYKTNEMLQEELKEYNKGKTRAEVVKELERKLFEIYEDSNLDVKPSQLENRGGAYYSYAACKLISSIYNDKKDIQVVNTKNNGAIKNISENSAVEVSSIITKEGPKPITVGELPIQINGLIQQIKSFEKIAVECAVKGDYNKGLLALTINPLIASDKLAKLIFDEMLQAHKEYLPQFFSKMGE